MNVSIGITTFIIPRKSDTIVIPFLNHCLLMGNEKVGLSVAPN